MSEFYQNLSHSRWDCKYHVVFVPQATAQSIVRTGAPPVGRDLSRPGPAEGVPDYRRASNAGPCAYVHRDSTESGYLVDSSKSTCCGRGAWRTTPPRWPNGRPGLGPSRPVEITCGSFVGPKASFALAARARRDGRPSATCWSVLGANTKCR